MLVFSFFIVLFQQINAELSGIATAAIGTVIYFFGGANDDGTLSKSVYSIDIQTKFEVSNAPMKEYGDILPSGFVNLVPFVKQNKIYLSGGFSKEGDALSSNSQIMVFDPSSKKITSTNTEANLPVKCSSQGTVLDMQNTNRVVFGGALSNSTTVPTSMTYIYNDLGITAESVLQNSPSPRMYSSLKSVSPNIYILTGGAWNKSLYLNDYYQFDVSQLKWTKLPFTMVHGRHSHRSGLYKNFIIQMGGIGKDISMIEVLNLKTNLSEAIPIKNADMGPKTLGAASITFLENSILVFKGKDKNKFILYSLQYTEVNQKLEFEWSDKFQMNSLALQSDSASKGGLGVFAIIGIVLCAFLVLGIIFAIINYIRQPRRNAILVFK